MLGVGVAVSTWVSVVMGSLVGRFDGAAEALARPRLKMSPMMDKSTEQTYK